MDGPAVGIDWSNGCWLAVVLGDGRYETVTTAAAITTIWERYHETAARIVFDVPIGLFEETAGEGPRVRRCDERAREVVGARYPSVFNPPAREAVELVGDGAEFGTVSDRNRAVTGKGLSQQAYYISGGIHEVDRLLRGELAPERPADRALRDRYVEGHPEVCFRALAGRPLAHTKTIAPGVGERLAALGAVLPGPAETFRQICDDLGDATHTDVDVDDVLDALVLAVVASADETAFRRLPAGEPPRDGRGLSMQIVYRAPEPLG